MVDERRGLFWPGGGDPARPTTGHGVAVQRELADDEDPSADIASRAVHDSGFVVEDAQVPHLAGDPLGIRPGVVMGHPDENAQPRANRPDNLGRLVDARSNDSHRGFGYSLYHGAHRPMVSTNRQA